MKDINNLVENNSPIKIPLVAVKKITGLIEWFHGLAFLLAAAALIIGIIPIIGGCFRSLISGIATLITLGALIIDVVFFSAAKARINAVGSASLGVAFHLTWLALGLLAVSTLISCCL